MALFCTKCGSPLAEGMKFCTNCGATIEGPPQAPMVVAPSVPAPASPVAASPAPSSGSPVVKIILIVVAVLVFLGLLSAGACVYMVYRAKQRINRFEKQVHATFPSPVPGQSTGSAIDLGVPIYPGAIPTETGSTMSMGKGAVKVQEYTTGDSADQVTAFYRDKLGHNAMVTQGNHETLVQLVGSNGLVNISIAPDGSTGKTKFTISSIEK